VDYTERNVVVALVCIAIAVILATVATGNPHVAAWSVLPLALAAWMVARS
jgi:hypothetical protein